MSADAVPGSVLGGRSGRPLATRSNLSGQVADRIRELVFDGTLKASQRVPQDAIAEELGVSRLPVREALITLESEGIIRSEPHRGAFVVPVKAEDIEDHYRMYGMAQGLATRRATGRLTDPTVDRLAQLIEMMEESHTATELHDLNWEFHALINKTGGSQRLLSILRQLSRNLPRSVYQSPPGVTPEANSQHRKILNALVAGKADVAENISREHVQAEGDYVVTKLRRDGILTLD